MYFIIKVNWIFEPSILYNIFDQAFPLQAKMKHRKSPLEPWMTQDLLKMRKKKYALERKWKRTKSAQIKAMSTACRNEYNKSIRACKRNYFLAKLH